MRESIINTLENGSKEEKIAFLDKLSDTTDPELLDSIVSRLDDDDIEVRGEAFSTLVLNQNKISEFLIKNLISGSKNIRGYLCLVLANRRDIDAIPAIIKLVDDPSSMVKSCALGALGFLKAENASKAIHQCFMDSNIEVKKSAIKAAIDIGDVPVEEVKKIVADDEELRRLIVLASQKS